MKATTSTLILAATILVGSVIMSISMIIAADKIHFSVRAPDDLDITLDWSKYSEPLRLKLEHEDTLNVRLWPPQNNYGVDKSFPVEIQSSIGVELKNAGLLGSIPLKVQVEQ